MKRFSVKYSPGSVGGVIVAVIVAFAAVMAAVSWLTMIVLGNAAAAGIGTTVSFVEAASIGIPLTALMSLWNVRSSD